MPDRLYRICVDPSVIRSNLHNHTKDPTMLVFVDALKKPIRAMRVCINGPSMIVFNAERPLPNGATVWVETHSEISVEIE